MNKSFRFYKNENDTKLMAIFVAQLVREGVTYAIKDANDSYVDIQLTGGY
jgi:hypothetical protein